VFHRLAFTWMDWGRKYGYFDSGEDAQAFYDEIVHMLAHQMAAPNSPQWFNTGLYAVYGIQGPAQGHYYADPETGEVKKSSSAYERPQPHACFILGVEDDLVNEGGILDLVTSEARLFKYGSGTGSNFSRLRARGEPLSGGGVSSGLLSFLKVADRSASAIKSGGTTRRAAKMVTLDADHPDIEEYIRWKVQEEQKVAAMVAGSRVLRQAADRFLDAVRPQAGEGEAPALEQRTDPLRNPALGRAVRQALDQGVPLPFVYKLLQLLRQGTEAVEIQELTTEWDEEAYNTVSGQSSNNSVRLSTAFMQAVLEDGDWPLAGRIDARASRTVKARYLWDLIAYAAWSCADPGIQFHSTVNEWHTCPADGEIRASNPCSEYMFLDDTACNLASLNLLKFYDAERGRFRIVELRHAIHLWTIVLEISVLMAQFPNRRIARRSFDFRTLGLGFANLGSLLMVMGLPYDSDAGRAVAGGLAAVITGQAYATSALLAAELGPFARFAANREPMLRVIRNHRRAAYNAPAAEYEGLSVLPRGLSPEHCPAELLAAARETWDEALRLGEAHGYRNAQVTAIAPTGTIGLIMDCDTTGVEPDYALVKFKKLAGGGFFKIINASIPPALRTLGYPQEQIREIVTFCVGHRTLRGAPHVSREELARRGFSEEALDRLEEAVKDTFLLAPLFSTAFLGRELPAVALGIPPEEASQPGFRLLERLGYSPGQVEEAERHICGAMTLEGAPHLREEHYPVFDTANPTGKRGRRFIPWPAHIEMMAAVQPFVSGAVSKTINMPAASTVEDVKGAHLLSWRRMLKSIALYRDGSKLSQPLSSLSGADEGLARSILALAGGAAAGAERQEPAAAEGVPAAGPPAGAGKAPPQKGAPDRSRRRPLPSRRGGYTQKVKIAGHSLFLRTGEYPDGRLGEIFLDMYREGAAFRSLLNSFAIAVSLGLQYGVPLEEYVDAFVFSRFEPSGIVQGHDHLKVTTSVLDLIFRDLALNYLKRLDLAQVKPDDLIATNTSAPADARRRDPNGSGAPEDGRSPGGSPEPAAAAAAAPAPAGQPQAPADAGPRETPGETVVPAEPVARQPGNPAAQSREGVLQASPRRASARRRDHEARLRPDRSEGGRHRRAGAEDGPEQGEAQRPAERLSPSLPEQRATARMQGYEGDPCPVCGHLTLVRNGTCLKCITCGSTTGCS
jgi:ribonucleoside-diphosphate reductase alpha chain